MVSAMDFGFLFDPMRKLFAIGYRVTDGSLDPGRYDLLASEARLASFVAIAKGDVPVSHWFRLGRALDPGGAGLGARVLVGIDVRIPDAVAGHARAGGTACSSRQPGSSWDGRSRYGAERGVPWGVSESGYNARDLEMTYQYSSFGVPGLGLRRGLSEDVVIAPYATGLAAMIDPTAAVQNFRRLAAAGASGAYGFYEALDYTAPRLPEGGSGRGGSRLHGAPPGHGGRRDRERRPRRRDARALPCRADRPGHRALAPGTDAAGRGGGAASRGRGAGGRRRARVHSASREALRLAARLAAAYPAALEWPVCGDADDGRLRI